MKELQLINQNNQKGDTKLKKQLYHYSCQLMSFQTRMHLFFLSGAQKETF